MLDNVYVLYFCLFYIFSYHTFDFSAKKNVGTLKPTPMKIFCVRHCSQSNANPITVQYKAGK